MKNLCLKILLGIFVFLLSTAQVFAVSATTPKDKNTKIYQVPILVYHSMGPITVKKESALQVHYRVTTQMFESQMKYLQDNKYTPISFATYVASLKNNTKLPDKAVVLTFDDGWKTQYEYAVPILQKYKFTATFFIITKSTSGPYMNFETLKDLVAKGFDIESHSETHPFLAKLDAKKLAKELTGSKKTLEDKLGIKVTTLAYPYYNQNEVVQKAVASAGYFGARAGWRKYDNSSEHIYELRSQEVVNNPNPFSSKRLPDLP